MTHNTHHVLQFELSWLSYPRKKIPISVMVCIYVFLFLLFLINYLICPGFNIFYIFQTRNSIPCPVKIAKMVPVKTKIFLGRPTIAMEHEIVRVVLFCIKYLLNPKKIRNSSSGTSDSSPPASRPVRT